MTETTYKNKTIFRGKCESCNRTIYPGETDVTIYETLDGKNLNVLEAYNLPVTEFRHKTFCVNCKN